MFKPDIFSLLQGKQHDNKCLIKGGKNFLTGKHLGNFAINSLGSQARKTKKYVRLFLRHWEKFQVEGHFTPIKGIGKKPMGYADFRNLFRVYCQKMLGARTTSETAILNDQSIVYGNMLRWLLTEQRRIGRTTVIYEAEGAFPSDEINITEIIRVMNLDGLAKIKLVPVPQTKLGLIDHEALLKLIKKTGKKLSVAAFGSGGVHWNTAQLLAMDKIGPAVAAVGGKTLVNIAHALGITELKLHEWKITAAVGCLYKFLSAGPGGPCMAFIHESQGTENLVPVGWFSFDAPIRTLQGKKANLKNGAQRMEASNPSVLQLIPAFAALEEYFKWGVQMIQAKNNALVKYFDECMTETQQTFNYPIVIITPKDERASEILFTTHKKGQAKMLHAYLNAQDIICDIRRGNRIRIGMYGLITRYEEIANLFNKMWDFFEHEGKKTMST